MKYRILIVEDDFEINKLLVSFLNKNGYETISAEDGNSASLFMKKQNYDLILMDLMLPNKSGEELIKELREYCNVPVIVLSAKSMLETRLEVLRLGADDYILKPFDLNEVLVRIEVVLRRISANSKKENIISSGKLNYHTDENYLEYDNKIISLTSKELQLIELFLQYPDKVFSKSNLYESVWNDVYYYEDNTINVHVSNLRSKLKKATGNDYIETVWGIGYRLRREND